MKVIAILAAVLVLLTSCVVVAPVVNRQESSQSSVLTESSSLAEQSAEAEDFGYNTYTNTRFGFSVPYPDYFISVAESDSGDGVTLTNAGTGEELKMWAAFNIDSLTPKAMLEEAKTRVSQIVMEDAQENSFYILYQGGNGDAGGTVNFFEYGLVKDDMVVRFLFKYPVELETQYDDIIKQMTTELTISPAEETAKG